jgi:hypothetical protein
MTGEKFGSSGAGTLGRASSNRMAAGGISLDGAGALGTSNAAAAMAMDFLAALLLKYYFFHRKNIVINSMRYWR